MTDRPRTVERLRHTVAELPLPLRGATLAGTALGLLGLLVGLVLGLVSYPSTAWFAALEVGVPAGLLGALLGFVAGSAAYLLTRGRPGPR